MRAIPPFDEPTEPGVIREVTPGPADSPCYATMQELFEWESTVMHRQPTRPRSPLPESTNLSASPPDSPNGTQANAVAVLAAG